MAPEEEKQGIEMSRGCESQATGPLLPNHFLGYVAWRWLRTSIEKCVGESSCRKYTFWCTVADTPCRNIDSGRMYCRKTKYFVPLRRSVSILVFPHSFRYFSRLVHNFFPLVSQLGEGVPTQMSSTSLDHGSKLRGHSPKALVWLNSVMLIFTQSLTRLVHRPHNGCYDCEVHRLNVVCNPMFYGDFEFPCC
ncbi:hypothetical protein TNCV_2960561 [Trichonephila clavipes]|nr:hypothetical protein TNCV_2960561 [Trichonephila clavipes]